MCGKGVACMVKGAYMAKEAHVVKGACIAKGGHAWQGTCMVCDMLGRGDVHGRRRRPLQGTVASCNAFLYSVNDCKKASKYD